MIAFTKQNLPRKRTAPSPRSTSNLLSAPVRYQKTVIKLLQRLLQRQQKPKTMFPFISPTRARRHLHYLQKSPRLQQKWLLFLLLTSCDPRKPIVKDKLIVKTCQLKKIYNPFGEQFLCWDRQDYLLKQCYSFCKSVRIQMEIFRLKCICLGLG